MRLAKGAAAALAGFLLVAAPAAAQKISRLGLGLTLVGGSGGALDLIVPAPAVAYSLRKFLSTANPLKAARIRRASDNAEQDIGFVGNDFDTASATSFCAATTCFVRTMYDQTLTGRDAVQATAGNQPELVFSCLGSQPCMRTTIAVTQLLSSTSYTPSSTVMSMNGVSKRVTGTSACYVVAGGLPNRIQHTNGSAGYTLLANVGVVASAAGAAENAWHSVTGILNGGSSSLVWDTTTVAGSGTATTASAQNIIAQGAGSTTCQEVEAIWWDATALTAQQVADLNANQQAYWMPYMLDTFSPPSGAYSFRRLRSAYTANKAVQLRRASDNAVLDIGFTAGGDFNTAAATTFCNATSCFGAAWYDQSGNAQDLLQATQALQLAFVFNCIGALPCLRNSAGVATQSASTVSAVTPSAVAVSMSAVVNRSVNGAGSTECLWFRQNGPNNRLSTFAAPWYVAAGAALAASPQPADNAWHSVHGVIAGAASVISVDGTETTGSVASSTAAGVSTIGTNTASATTCNFAEEVLWDGYALTSAERAALTANQRAYWGF